MSTAPAQLISPARLGAAGSLYRRSIPRAGEDVHTSSSATRSSGSRLRPLISPPLRPPLNRSPPVRHDPTPPEEAVARELPALPERKSSFPGYSNETLRAYGQQCADAAVAQEREATREMLRDELAAAREMAKGNHGNPRYDYFADCIQMILGDLEE